MLRVIGIASTAGRGCRGWARGDAAAGPDAAAWSGSGGGLQYALWLPPLRRQCCPWHSGLQYRTALHLAHPLLTLSRPVASQSRLPQRMSPSAAAFFPLPIIFDRL